MFKYGIGYKLILGILNINIIQTLH